MAFSSEYFLYTLLSAKELRTPARRGLVRRLIRRYSGLEGLAGHLKAGYRLDAGERELAGILGGYRHLEAKIDAAVNSERLKLVAKGQDDYPELLNQISDAPLGLIFQGRMAALLPPAVAIVGSRRASPSGLDTARFLARELVKCKLVVVSGLALGIDAAAHQGAVDAVENAEASGVTVAVFGCGHHTCYPRRNRNLASKIIQTGGLLVSEYPPWEPPQQRNFPERNRIISGLCLGVVVVEAASRSGSLITARMALEQGRDVLAVPGPRASPLSKGCHSLIRQGAALVEGPEDILQALNLPALVTGQINYAGKTENAENLVLSNVEQAILDAIGFQYTSHAAVVAGCQIDGQILISSLAGLELKELIESYADGYIRVR